MLNLFRKKEPVNLSDVINIEIAHEPIKIEFENYGKVADRFNALCRVKSQSKFHLNILKKAS